MGRQGPHRTLKVRWGPPASGLGHCGYRRYLYHQGNEQTTGGTVEAAAKPWLIKSAPPAIPFDTPVTGIGHRPVVPHHHHIKGGLGVVHCFATEKETPRIILTPAKSGLNAGKESNTYVTDIIC